MGEFKEILVRKEKSKMILKIKRQRELRLLRQLNPHLGKIKIPQEILKTVDELLKRKDLGKEGCISIFTAPVKRDISDILEALEMDEKQVAIPDDNIWQIPIKGRRHPMKKKREWHFYDIILPLGLGKTYVVYSTKVKKEED